ncbi:MAG: GNAT family N-acetyltransferase [bacterium]|nr:GNAT family N-acetyltransferase [bacterium]
MGTQFRLWRNEYDSQFFGQSFFQFALDDKGQPISDLISQARAEGANHLVGLLPSSQAEAIEAAQQAGLHLLLPIGDLDCKVEGPCLGEKYRAGGPEDAMALAELAGSCFSYSRFNRMKATKELAGAYHRAWALNCLEGDQADEVLLVGDSVLGGFVGVKAEDDTARIVLLGVASGQRGKGWGLALCRAALDWSRQKGMNRLRVRTEADNIPSMSLYCKAGFLPIGHSVYLSISF